MLMNDLDCRTRKSVRPTMFLTTVGSWLLLNFFFIDRYIRIITVQSSWTETAISAIVISWILLTSFYANFHTFSFLFSLNARKKEKIVRNYGSTPPVAIFYTCMNDMKEKAVDACLAQEYPDYTLYVLDDSTDPGERERVDSLKKRHNERVFLIRRREKKGFKAGNLNNALRQIGNRYNYICVIDADELIPPTFLRETVAIAEANEELGFIQAAHEQYGETKYGKLTGDGIGLHWNYYLPARNRYGFVYFYGHGALLRVQVINSIGGFPEVVSEDLALATKMREAGYRGYFAHDIKCLEETPSSYGAFRRRNRKIISGTLEFLVKFYSSFMRSTNVSFIEKIDLLIASSVIYLPIPFVLFLIFIHAVMLPISLGDNIGMISSFTGTKDLYAQMPTRFHLLYSWDFRFLILFTVFAPLCYLIPDALRSPKKVILYVLRMGAVSLSVSLQTIGSAVSWLVTKRTFFIPTGDRSHRFSGSFFWHLEQSIGIAMIIISILMGSFCLTAVGLSLALVPTLVRNNLNVRLSAGLLVFPMVMTIIALLGMPLFLLGMTSMFAGVAFARQ